MRIILFIIFLLSGFQAMACSPLLEVYFILNNKVYFGTPNNSNRWNYIETSNNIPSYQVSDSIFVLEDPNDFFCIKEGNIPSFRIDSISHFYATDKNKVYLRGKIIKNANPSSFHFLGGEYTLFGEKLGYSKDNNSVFYHANKVDSVDIASFRVIIPLHYSEQNEQGYAFDKSHVFLDGYITAYDPATFSILGWSYTKDKSGIYSEHKLIDSTTGKPYEINKPVLICNDKIYYSGTPMDIFDTGSYTIIKIYAESTPCGSTVMGGVLSKDKKGIYINDEKLDWLDYDSFENIDGYTIKDKNGVYQFSLFDSNNRSLNGFKQIK